MKQDEKKTARRIQTVAICGCLCLAAVGAGVAYRAFDRPVPQQEPVAEVNHSVAAVQSPTIDTAKLEQERQKQKPAVLPKEEKQPQQAAPKAEKQMPTAEVQPVFAYPVEGKVVLPYSVDHAIYDPTLEQYRTNAGISLAVPEGTAVQAAADGVVQEVSQDAESGTTVTLSHGSAWQTSYGQLKPEVAVKKGDTVKKGTVIGNVAAPTKYGATLGSHLEFAMKQDGVPKDPQTLVAK